MAGKLATTRLQPVYDDEPSMSLELFGYSDMVVDGDNDDGDAAMDLPQLAFLDNFKAAGCGSPAGYYSWAYNASGGTSGGATSSSSSSVLSFEHGAGGVAGHHQLTYDASAAAADDDCTLWMDGGGMADHHGVAKFGFMDTGSADAGLQIRESGAKPAAAQKRACPAITGAEAATKKHCGGGGRRSKAKAAAPSKDPQSVVAKVRRERISERLKVLQDLVPNGTKVDMVTMLEKAIGYVKFLQLQVKVLASDEFWPVQGGKAPELSQVKDALDAILSSQRQS